MKSPLFKRKGIFFVPVTLTGWIVLIATLGYAAYTFMDIDSRSHSASDTLMNFAFRLLIIGAVYSGIGFLTSQKVKEG